MMSSEDHVFIAEQITNKLNNLLSSGGLTVVDVTANIPFEFGITNFRKEQKDFNGLIETYDIIEYEDAIEIIYICKLKHYSKASIRIDLKDYTNPSFTDLHLCLILKE